MRSTTEDTKVATGAVLVMIFYSSCPERVRTAHGPNPNDPNVPGGAMGKSPQQQIGAGQGDINTPESSLLSHRARSRARDPIADANYFNENSRLIRIPARG